MTKLAKALGPVLIIAASAALAHSGVQNPTVKARMDAMSTIGENTKVLGTMAKGEVTFDAESARTAASNIASHAALIEVLFQESETDPKSEALPVIWETYSDFSGKAEVLEVAASEAAISITEAGDLRPALAAIGGACKSCHKTYRK